MAARVIVIAGPAWSGKTARLLARYRKALAERWPGSTLWLSPNWRAAAAIRDNLVDRDLPGCLSPAVMTFDQFAEVVLRASPEPVRPLSRLMKRQLVRLLLDEQLAAGRIRHFRAIAQTGGLVDQLCELISELKRLDIWPDRFRQACQSRGMTEKDAEVLALYEAYQAVLTRHHLYDAEGRFWSARKLLRQGRRGSLERLRIVMVDGFADFTPPQHEILQLLAGWVEELWITLPLDAGSGGTQRADLFAKSLQTLAALRKRHAGLVVENMSRPAKPAWPAMAHLEAHLFADPRQVPPVAETTGIEILAASRQLGEIELIGSRIKRLLAEGSEATDGRAVSPGDVAVVFRSLGDVDSLVREVFGKLGIPYALESGQPLHRSRALMALVGLVKLEMEDWPFRGLLAVLSNNYFQPDWPEWQDGRAAVAAEHAIRRLQIPRGKARLLQQLQREAGWRRRAKAGPDIPRDELAAQSQLALALLGRLARALDDLPERASLRQWSEAWTRLAETTGLLRAIQQDEPPNGQQSGRRIADQLAWDTLIEALKSGDQIARLHDGKPPELDRAEGLAALVDTLGSVAVRDRGDESGRVRVLSAASVRALRIPYLFFAGLAERSFPPPERHDRLYGEAEYRQLIERGLPLVARTERTREEMLLFYEVLTRASRRVWLSYPALDEAAQPLSPSPFLQEVEHACGGRVRRTEVPSLSPIPQHDEPLTVAEFRVKAVAAALEGDASRLAGLLCCDRSSWAGAPPAFVETGQRTVLLPTGQRPIPPLQPGLAESILAGLRIVAARADRDGFGPAEGMLAGSRAQREIGARFGPGWTFTATELEQYALCPYQFFLERVLGIRELEDLELAVDYLGRGRLVHQGLAYFHQRVNDLGQGPTSPAAIDEKQAERLLEETRQRLARQVGPAPLEAALQEVDLRLWSRWASDYLEQHRQYDAQWRECDEPLRPTWFEVSFGKQPAAWPTPAAESSGVPAPEESLLQDAGEDSQEDSAALLPSTLSTDQPLELAADGGVIRIAGRIDRIDAGVVAGRTVFNVIDYKTGASRRYSREAVVSGEVLQLPLYALAAEQLLLADWGAVPWQAGYWYLQQGGFRAKQSLAMHAWAGGRIEPTPEWQSLRQQVVARVAGLVAQIRAAHFPVYSADEQCTRVCPFRTVCRIGQVRSLEKIWQPLAEKD